MNCLCLRLSGRTALRRGEDATTVHPPLGPNRSCRQRRSNRFTRVARGRAPPRGRMCLPRAVLPPASVLEAGVYARPKRKGAIGTSGTGLVRVSAAGK